MKKYHLLQPEVIIGLGNNTIFAEKYPPFRTIKKLHICFEDWLGDDLMENSGCFIVTNRLKEGLDENFPECVDTIWIEATKDECFEYVHGSNAPLPDIYWAQIIGKENIHDLFLGKDGTLRGSNEFIEYLKNNFTVDHLEIDPERNEFDDLLDRMLSERKEQSL